MTEEDLENILDESSLDFLIPPTVSTPINSPIPAGEPGFPAGRKADGAGGQATGYTSRRRGSTGNSAAEPGLAGASGIGGGVIGGSGGSGSGESGGLWRPAADAVAAVSAIRRAANTLGGSLTNVVLGTAAATTDDDEWPALPESAAAAAARRTSAEQIRQGAGLPAVDGERRLGPREFERVLRQQMTLYIQARHNVQCLPALAHTQIHP